MTNFKGKIYDFIINTIAGAIVVFVILFTFGMISLVSLGIMRVLQMMFEILGM